MEQKNVKIKGMHCMGCALGLEEKLEKLPFITEASVDFKEGIANIKYYKDKLDMREVKAVVEELGFSIVEE